MILTQGLWLNCISMLVHDGSKENYHTVEELVKIYDDQIKLASTPDELSKFYVSVIKLLISKTYNIYKKEDQIAFQLTFKNHPVVAANPEAYELLTEILITRDSIDADTLEAKIKDVQNAYMFYKCNAVVRNAFGTLQQATDIVDPSKRQAKLSEIIKGLKFLTENTLDTVKQSKEKRFMTDVVIFDDIGSVNNAIKRHSERDRKSVIRWGLQGLNLMFGSKGGSAGGESIVFNALSHNYKSGMLQSVPNWTVQYNTPMFENQKELILLISIENEAFQNFMWMFKKAYFEKHKKPPTDLTDEQIASEAISIYGEYGYKLRIHRFLPSEFGYEDYVDLINYYQSMGFVIRLVSLDYAAKMKYSAERSSAANHLAIKELYSNMCNYNKNAGITFVTAHQLNRKARELVSMGHQNVVKKFTDEHLADSSDVQREVDVSIFMHIEDNADGVSFLTMQLRKHRYVDDTPTSNKYCAYPFHQGIGIIDDINSAPGYTRDIHGFSHSKLGESLANAIAIRELLSETEAVPIGKVTATPELVEEGFF